MTDERREPEPGTDEDRADQQQVDEQAHHDPETQEDTASGGAPQGS